MTAVVQAKCPKCGKLLRIPADWVSQAMRCKHCNQVIQARTVSPDVQASTPPPAPARKQASSKTPPAAPGARVPSPRALPRSGPQPTPATAVPPAAPPVAATVAPVAIAPRSDSPFGDLEAPGPTDTAPSPRRRRRKQANWVPPVIVLGVLVVGIGVGAIFAWPMISGSRNSDGTGAVNDSTKDSRADGSGRTAKATTPKTNEGDQTNPGQTPEPTKGAMAGEGGFPRRALIISVHNYLYANPTHAGPPGAGSRNISNLFRVLNNGLRIPTNQILHVSDLAAGGKQRVPLKSVIEQALTSFLDSSRPQDRILVFFIGHGTEIDNEPYLMPIEGELEEAKTLIPLKWFYEKLAACKARQKVFVVDVARYSPTYGRERPGGDPLGAKFDEALKNPPAGVQAWSACVAEQQSYETDDSPMGLFLDQLVEALPSSDPAPAGSPVKGKKPAPAAQKATDGFIQRPGDPFPLDKLVDSINKNMEKELKPLKLQQVSRLSGKESNPDLAYDPKESLAPPPPSRHRRT